MKIKPRPKKLSCLIAILSDIHDNWTNLDKVISFLKDKSKIKQIIICGDVCAPITLGKITDSLKDKKIHLVYGNVDGDHKRMEEIEKKKRNLKIYKQEGKIELCGKKIGFSHYRDEALEMIENENFDIIFYGHDHKPWEEKIKGTILLNPGELTGFFGKSTFAIYDLERMQAKLKILQNL